RARSRPRPGAGGGDASAPPPPPAPARARDRPDPRREVAPRPVAYLLGIVGWLRLEVLEVLALLPVGHAGLALLAGKVRGRGGVASELALLEAYHVVEQALAEALAVQRRALGRLDRLAEARRQRGTLGRV